MALAALVVWPIIPIMWLQVHGRPELWRRLGGFTYAVVISEWLAVAYLSITFQSFLLGQSLNLGVLSWVGALPLFAGLVLQVWASRLLGVKALVGYSELKPSEAPNRPVISGPFSTVRHPTYLAHTMMLVGVFLITGYVGTGVLALIDFLSSYFVIIPLEERELASRFGSHYENYKGRVPKYLPKIR